MGTIVHGGGGGGGPNTAADVAAALAAVMGANVHGGGAWLHGARLHSAAHRPSRTGREQGPWIWVVGPGGGAAALREDGSTGELAAIFQAGVAQESGAAGREATIASMLAWVASSGQRGGKWVTAVRRADADRVWGLVARLTAAGVLGPAAKVATADPPRAPGAPPPAHQLIIYTADCFDAADVRRVLDVLVAAGIVAGGRVIGYKLDAWTLLEMRLGEEAAWGSAAAGAALDAWRAPRWRAHRTLYQSDRPAGAAGVAAHGGRELPQAAGGARAAARAVAAVLAAAAQAPAAAAGAAGAAAAAVAAPPPPRPLPVGAVAAGILADAAAGGAGPRPRPPAAPAGAILVVSSGEEEEGGDVGRGG